MKLILTLALLASAALAQSVAPAPVTAPLAPSVKAVTLPELSQYQLKDVGTERGDFLKSINSAVNAVLGTYNQRTLNAIAPSCKEAGAPVAPNAAIQSLENSFVAGDCKVDLRTMQASKMPPPAPAQQPQQPKP